MFSFHFRRQLSRGRDGLQETTGPDRIECMHCQGVDSQESWPSRKRFSVGAHMMKDHEVPHTELGGRVSDDY